MRTENVLRVSPEMRKLLEEEVNWFKQQNINISMTEASRIVANRAKNKKERRSKFFDSTWNKDIGMR